MGNENSRKRSKSINQQAGSKSESGHSPRPKSARAQPCQLLTTTEKKLLTVSCNRFSKSGINAVGAQIFLKIFNLRPELKKMFAFDTIPSDQLQFSSRFQMHAQTFTKILDLVVRSIDDLNAVQEYLRELGRKHVAFQSRGFKIMYWDTFAQAMTECALGFDGKKAERRLTMNAWRVLVCFIIDEMRRGFSEEFQKRMITSERQ